MKQPGVLLLPLNEMLDRHRIPGMKTLGVLLLPLDGMLVHRIKHEATRSIFASHSWMSF